MGLGCRHVHDRRGRASNVRLWGREIDDFQWGELDCVRLGEEQVLGGNGWTWRRLRIVVHHLRVGYGVRLRTWGIQQRRCGGDVVMQIERLTLGMREPCRVLLVEVLFSVAMEIFGLVMGIFAWMGQISELGMSICAQEMGIFAWPVGIFASVMSLV